MNRPSVGVGVFVWKCDKTGTAHLRHRFDLSSSNEPSGTKKYSEGVAQKKIGYGPKNISGVSSSAGKQTDMVCGSCKFLMGKRVSKHGKDTWSVPGGYL